MGGCRRDDRPATDRALQSGELGLIGGRRRSVELEVAGDDDMRGAQFAEALGVGRRARQAKIEPPHQVADRHREIAPAPERIFRQPAVDQDHRHAAPGGLDHHVRPQVGFYEQRDIGPPMREEAAHEHRHVDRHELMNDAARQPLLGQPARGDGARSHQHIDLARADALDQRQHADQFADARAMQPNQRSRRPRHDADAAPLGKAQEMFLAAPLPPFQQHRRERRHRHREQPVGAQGCRQPVAHGALLPIRSAIS